jgi:septum formation protein
VTNLVARIYLASQSPRRAELLQQIAVDFVCLPIDVDETPLANEAAVDYVQRVALAKARAGWAQCLQQGLPPLPVLAADTSVILDGQIMGKPRNRDHGLAMLSALAGRTHQVLTAVCLCFQGEVHSVLSTTQVSFRAINTAELEQYWASGEPLGKAGAYAIQGRAAVFVEDIHGSYSGVVGLPLLETHQLLLQVTSH